MKGGRTMCASNDATRASHTTRKEVSNMLSFAAVASLVVLTAMWGGLTNEGAPYPEDTTDVGEVREEVLGPCGCTDYHMADCPINAPASAEWYDEPYYDGPDDDPRQWD